MTNEISKGPGSFVKLRRIPPSIHLSWGLRKITAFNLQNASFWFSPKLWAVKENKEIWVLEAERYPKITLPFSGRNKAKITTFHSLCNQKPTLKYQNHKDLINSPGYLKGSTVCSNWIWLMHNVSLVNYKHSLNIKLFIVRSPKHSVFPQLSFF